MTQFETIKNLRNQNKHEEAYQLTKSQLTADPQNIWNRRAHSWSIYYLIKKHTQAGQMAQAKKYRDEFLSMNMPAEETLLHERMGYFEQLLDVRILENKSLIQEGRFEDAFSLLPEDSPQYDEAKAWTVYYMVRSHIKTGQPASKTLKQYLEKFQNQVVAQRKLVFKLLIQESCKLSPEFWAPMSQKKWMDYLGLFKILEEEDYQMQSWQGKKIISMAERIHIAYSKALIRESVPSEEIQNYLDRVVSPLLEPHHEMLYVPFFKAKLLLAMGSKEEGIQAFLPFARKKQKEFWVWQVFAEAHEEDKELYLACLCKALDCPSKPEFLSGIKERLILFLIQSKAYNWAKTEVNELLTLREKMSWGLRTHHREWKQSEWYKKAKTINLKEQYRSITPMADELLGLSPMERVIVIVNKIQESKKLFNFGTMDHQVGFANYRTKPSLYDCYQLTGRWDKSFFQISKMEIIYKEEVKSHLCKVISGSLRIKAMQNFGFVDGIFVPPSLIQDHHLKNGMVLKGKAIYGPVKGKEKWSWKLVGVYE